jgi:6-phosphogluconolactonase/glucosamine-6-phosphate isomerase/deaminase
MQLKPYDDIIPYLAERLNEHLNRNETVLWLIPGGSAIAIAVEVAKRIANNPNLSNLSVTLTDERYGNPGHADENWQQLNKAGLALDGAALYPVLHGEDGLTTAHTYATTLATLLDAADYSVGLFGIGADSHIAGIKPASDAVDTHELTSYYIGEDFERVTISFEVMKQLNEVLVAASGEQKFPTIRAILHETYPLDERPAHILQTLSNVSLFTEYKEN